MREIKFRAWDTVEKEMTPWEDILSNLHLYVSGNYIDKYPLMQFTGLRDKSGREIYEGDILEDFDPSVENLLVKFGEGAFYLEEQLDVMEAKREPLIASFFDYDWENYTKEVIGNIYENPLEK